METKRIINSMYSKFIACSIFIFSIALIFTMSGNGAFLQIPETKLPYALESTVDTILFFANMFVLFSVSLSIYNKSIFSVLIGYIPIYVMAEWLNKDTLAASTVAPLIYVLFVAKLTNRVKETVCNAFKFTAITALYQITILLIRFGTFKFGHIVTNTNHNIILSIDLMLFYFIIYFIWRYNYYDELFRNSGYGTNRRNFWSSNELPILLENTEHKEDVLDRQAINELTNAPLGKQLKVILLTTLYQLSQILIVFVLCAVGGVWVQCVIIMTAYFFSTTVIKRRWHSNSMIVCTCCTAILFYTSSLIALPVNISILGSVIEGFILTIVLWKIELLSEKYKIMKNLLYFDIDNCNEEDIIVRCELLNLTDNDTDFALDSFVYNKENEDMINKYTLDEYNLDSIKNEFKLILTDYTL